MISRDEIATAFGLTEDEKRLLPTDEQVAAMPSKREAYEAMGDALKAKMQAIVERKVKELNLNTKGEQ